MLELPNKGGNLHLAENFMSKVQKFNVFNCEKFDEKSHGGIRSLLKVRPFSGQNFK